MKNCPWEHEQGTLKLEFDREVVFEPASSDFRCLFGPQSFLNRQTTQGASLSPVTRHQIFLCFFLVVRQCEPPLQASDRVYLVTHVNNDLISKIFFAFIHQAILTDTGAVNLECKVIGVPQPVLKWYKDGRELKAGDIHKIVSGEDGTCCLGTYTCEAHNCMGTVSSSASLLGFEGNFFCCHFERYTMCR